MTRIAAALLALTCTALPALADDGPRPGRYVCHAYSGGAGKFRFYVDVAGGTYRQHSPTLTPGRYSYDGASRHLQFTSGQYRDNNWMGIFSVEREGKTHKIVLRDRASEAQGPRVAEYANIYCSNSTDS
jgi:hypothetical protein